MIFSKRAAFFDAGGTLFHMARGMGDVLVQSSLDLGHTFEPSAPVERIFQECWIARNGFIALKANCSDDADRRWWLDLLTEVLTKIGSPLDPEQYHAAVSTNLSRAHSWQLIDGAIDVLQELKRRAIVVGVVSNWNNTLSPICRELGIAPLVDFVLCSTEVGAAKPKPEIFERALERAGVESADAVFVGDTWEDDIVGARGVGMDVIHFDRRSPEIWDSADGVVSINSIRSLLAPRTPIAV